MADAGKRWGRKIAGGGKGGGGANAEVFEWFAARMRGWWQQRTLFFASQLAPPLMSAATHSWCPFVAAPISAVTPTCASGCGREGEAWRWRDGGCGGAQWK